MKKIKASLTSAKTQIDTRASSVDDMAGRVREQLDAIRELTRTADENEVEAD